jgi:hypothetical protein
MEGTCSNHGIGYDCGIVCCFTETANLSPYKTLDHRSSTNTALHARGSAGRCCSVVPFAGFCEQCCVRHSLFALGVV